MKLYLDNCIYGIAGTLPEESIDSGSDIRRDAKMIVDGKEGNYSYRSDQRKS